MQSKHIKEVLQQSPQTTPIKPITRLSADNLKKIAVHYPDIKIIFNGETKTGESLIKKNKAHYEEKLKKYNSTLRYGMILQEYYEVRSYTQRTIEGEEELYQLLQPYLTTEGKHLRQNLSEADLETITKKIEANKTIQNAFDIIYGETFETVIQQMKIDANDCCITKSQMVEEVQCIQNGLPNHEYVAYIYTNNRMHGAAHFEVLIIGKNEIIKPIHWRNPEDGIDTQDIPTMYYTSLVSPILKAQEYSNDQSINIDPDTVPRNLSDAELPIAQVEPNLSAALGFLYLTKLLNNNTKTLRDFTLRFAYYNEKNEKSYFFFPSPQVLRYSQSDDYNYIMYLMVTSEKDATFISNDGKLKFKVMSLKNLLEQSLKRAIKNDDKEAINQHYKLLAELPTFSKMWQQEYKITFTKRSRFNNEVDYLRAAYYGLVKQINCKVKTNTKKTAPNIYFIPTPAPTLQHETFFSKKEKKLEAIWRKHENSDTSGITGTRAIFETYKKKSRTRHKNEVDNIISFIDANPTDAEAILNKIKYEFKYAQANKANLNGNYFRMLAFTMQHLETQLTLLSMKFIT